MMIETRWRERELPDIEGLTLVSGETYRIDRSGLSAVKVRMKINDWLHVGILAEADLFGGKYRVKCGESPAHGSIGVVVLENAKTDELVWFLVSGMSNPFDQIEIKGSCVIVLSTSGSVLRFRTELRNAALFIA